MRLAITAVLTAMLAAAPALTPAQADEIERRTSPHSVDETMSRLEAAITGAGAKVIAIVDHSAGAAEAGLELRPTRAIIFGNPKIGTPLMQESQSIAASVPQQIAVYEDENGDVQVVWVEFGEIAEMHGLDDDSEAVERVEKALETLAGKAVASE